MKLLQLTVVGLIGDAEMRDSSPQHCRPLLTVLGHRIRWLVVGCDPGSGGIKFELMAGLD